MNQETRILIVEDEEDLRHIIDYNLRRAGYRTQGVETGEQGLTEARRNKPDLVLLDLMLPGMHGLDVCRRIKQDATTRDIAIIIVSARSEESDVVRGLELGADDYVCKPFSPRILLARVQAVLRRAQQDETTDNRHLEIDGLEIDADKFRVMGDHQAIDVTKSEFGILHFLASHPGWVFTRYQIVDAIRGEHHVVTERAIDVQIARLRKKLGRHAALIETVRGIGYRFQA